MFVVNAPRGGSSVTIYAAGAHGDVAPTRTIAGPATEMGAASGIAIGPRGDVYVSDHGLPGTVGAILIYDPHASGNVAPVRRIGAARGGVAAPFGVALDGAGAIFAVHHGD